MKRITGMKPCAIGAVLLAAIGLLAGDARGADQGEVVLNARTFWRGFTMFREPVAMVGEDPVIVPRKKEEMKWDSPPPPADWTRPDFDDSDWWRAPGPFYGGYGHWNGVIDTVALICLRGRFVVDDPAKIAALTFSCEYRGGIVIHVNGREVTRANIREQASDKKETPVPPDALAEVYPLEVYAQTNGTSAIKWGWGEPEKFAERCKMRIRKLNGVVIPAEYLQKGVNVLAIQIHRAPYAEGARNLKEWWSGFRCHVGVNAVELRVAPVSAARDSGRREPGLRVWNANPMTAVFDMDYGDSSETLRPIRIVGARNGTFSGQVVIGSDTAIRGLKAVVGDLRQKHGGGGRIMASAVSLRFARTGGFEAGMDGRYGTREVSRFDALAEAPPTEVPLYAKSGGIRPFVAVQPVWITVSVPADAPAGDYEGVLTLSVEGQKDRAVSVALSVADWTLPDPRTYTTFADVIQSPESVALQYEVPLWSDRHWELLERSFQQLGRIGNKTVHIPILCRTHFGNSEGMVRWKRAASGVRVQVSGTPRNGVQDTNSPDTQNLTPDTYTGDFTIMEKYLDIAEKYLGKPPVICFYVWDLFSGGGYFSDKYDAKKVRPTPVSLLDPASGTVTTLEGPTYFDEGAEAFFRPVMDELRERIKKRGLEKSMTLGIGGDLRPVKAQVDLWKRLLPEAGWVIHTHGELERLHGVPVPYIATVWQARFAPDPTEGYTRGWTRDLWNHKGQAFAHFPRELWFDKPLTQNRLLGEHNIGGMQVGFGRLGADFWPVIKDGKGRRTIRLPNRYPESNWAQLSVKTCLFDPGPDGAISTVRWEMIVEGVQECEARIFIEKALLDKAARARLGEETARRLQLLLDERIRSTFWGWDNAGWFAGTGWQERSARLYAAAGEVAKALSARP